MAPVLTLTEAHLLTAFFSISYVGSLYLSRHARLRFRRTHQAASRNPYTKSDPSERWRDDPDVIRARLTAVSIATVASVVVVYYVVYHFVLDASIRTAPGARKTVLVNTVNLLGLSPISSLSISALWTDVVRPSLVTPSLFLGPLYAHYLYGMLPFQLGWGRWFSEVKELMSTWVGIRNYLWAPASEEVVFRSCVLAVYHLAGVRPSRAFWLTPWAFGLAHVHHAWDTYNRYGRTRQAARQAIFSSLFQLLYTSIFGTLAAFLFLRTGSLWVPLSAHIFCNVMGVPRVTSEAQDFPHRRGFIYTAYILGIVMFAYTLVPWTRTQSIYWPLEDHKLIH